MRLGSALLRLMFTFVIGSVIVSAIYLTNRLHQPVVAAPESPTNDVVRITPTTPATPHSESIPKAPVQGTKDEVVLEYMKREIQYRLAGDEAQANKAREELRHYLSNHQE